MNGVMNVVEQEQEVSNMQTAQEFVIDPNDPPTFERVWRMFRKLTGG
jgi:hypothetical protein